MLQEKHWNKDIEREIVEKWKEEGDCAFKEDGKELYSIDTPPPYVNTPIHIGHATTYVLMDMFARFRRMIGYNVLFPLGLDRNGLPIEIAAEKRFGVSLGDVPREKFLEMCRQVLEESSAESVDSFLRLGISFNSWVEGPKAGDMYLTDSVAYRVLTQATFIDLWKKGLIYEDTRINNYCPGCKTTLADDEVDYKDLPAVFVDVVFTVKESGEKIVIGTTRSELICTCGMVIFHPDDVRYKHLNGKTALTPLYDKEVPIKAHPLADPQKGTGLVMMCSAGDQSDIRFFREQELEPVIAINVDGRMNENAGFLKGFKVEEAREEIIKRLKDHGALARQRKIMHRTPICERSKDAIEFIAMPEFYLKQVKHKDDIRKIAYEINFFSPKSRQILLDWIDSVSIDWAISRRRYYATEIPLWYCKKCNETIVPPKGKYYQPWREPPPVEKCPGCGSSDFRGEERVLDTWFDSSISPLYVLKYPSEFFKKHRLCSLRPQGKEIIRNWLYYTLLRCFHATSRNIFDDVWIHYHVVDESGRKMSKSLGNITDPQEVLEKYGAEPFRLWTAVEGNITNDDFRCSFERIEGAGKTITKLWNIARFISMFPQKMKPSHLMEIDKWIIQEMNELVDFSLSSYQNYDFHNPAARLKHFIWETFSSHYIELVKSRAYNQDKKFSDDEQASALYTLHYCLDTLLKLLAPIIPIITYKIYFDLHSKDIHKEKFPAIEHEYKVPFSTNEIEELDSMIWKTKKDASLSLKSPVKVLTLNEKFKSIEKDLVAAHNVEKIRYDEFSVKL